MMESPSTPMGAIPEPSPAASRPTAPVPSGGAPSTNPFARVAPPDPRASAQMLASPPTWQFRKRPKISYDAVQAAIELDGAATRRQATPVRKSFVRTDTDQPAPLSQLVTIGGRGGAVAIRLYLALLWRCSSSPYNTDKPARAWATLLDLEDPPGKGARRIAAALKTLEKVNLIRITREPSRNVITLLDESGDGSEYLPPSTEWYLANRAGGAEAARRHVYFKISSQWWIDGDLQKVRTAGLVMLLILMAEQGSDSKKFEEGGIGRPVWWSTDKFPQRYRISAKTRSAGTNELTDRGLLLIERQALPDVPGSTFARRRYRNIYRLVNPPSDDAPEPGPLPPAPPAADDPLAAKYGLLPTTPATYDPLAAKYGLLPSAPLAERGGKLPKKKP